MKISEVIKKLQKIQERYGDLSVHVTTKYYDDSFESIGMVVKIKAVFYIK